MPISDHTNFALSTLASPPSGTAGTSLSVQTGHGTLFPAVPFNATIWPPGVAPTASNAEIVRVTAKVSDTFTVTRAQEDSTARTHGASYQIAATITARTLTDVEYGAHGIINVKDPVYGAVGDGATDDTAAIQAAITAAYATNSSLDDPWGRGARVYLPSGIFGVSADIDIPPQVIVEGAGVRTTVIRWISGTVTNAVVTSNLSDQHGFVHGAGCTNLTIDANGQAVGFKVRGWNEGCIMDNLMVREYTDATDGGVQLLSASAGSTTHTTQNLYVNRLWMFGKTGCRNLLLDGCNRVTFDNLTISLVGGEAGPMLTGVELRQVVRQSVFVNPNVEDCTRAYDLGTSGAISANLFVNPLMDVPVGAAPADTTIGSVTATMGFVVRAAAGTTSATWGSIIGIRDGYGYEYTLFDASLNIYRDSGVANTTGAYFGIDDGQTTTPRVDRHVTFTDADTTPTVAAGNFFTANNTGATSITTFDDGIEFQAIEVRFANSNTTLVDGATLQLAGGANFVGSSNDIIGLRLVSGVWLERYRSVN